MKRTIIYFIIILNFGLLKAEYRYSYSFLNVLESGNIEINSKAGVSTIEGIDAVYGNPSGFADNTYKVIEFSFTENIGDTRKFSLFYGFPFKGFNFITGVKYFYLKEPVIVSEREINYDAFEFLTLLAKKIRFIKAGIKINGIYSRIGDYNSFLLLLSAGIQMRIIKKLTGGIFIENTGFNIKKYFQKENLPVSYNAGVSWDGIKIKFIDLKVFLNLRYEEEFTLSEGVKILFYKKIFTGFGITHTNNQNIFTLGTGGLLESKKTGYEIHYSIKLISGLENIHYVSLTIRK